MKKTIFTMIFVVLGMILLYSGNIAAQTPGIGVNGGSGGWTITNGDATPETKDGTYFGTVAVGSSIYKFFTLSNVFGEVGSDLHLTGTPWVAISGSSAFSVTQQPSTLTHTYHRWAGAYGADNFIITFAPTAAGVQTAIISIASDDPDDNPFTFTISGNDPAMDPPEINVTGNSTSIVSGDITPSTLDGTDYGLVLPGNTADQIFTIENTVIGTLNLTGTPMVALTGSAAFSVTVDPTTPISGIGSTSFTIHFAPGATGLHQATVSIANNDENENPYTFAIQGMAGEPEINVLGNGVSIANNDATPETADGTDFGQGSMPGFIKDQIFTIANTGTADLNLTGTPLVSVTGSPAFSVTVNPTTPVDDEDGTTTFTVHFAPTTLGVQQATVTIPNDDADEAPYSFVVQGEGIANSAVSVIVYNDLNLNGKDDPGEPIMESVEVILFAPVDGYDNKKLTGIQGTSFQHLWGGKYKVAINMATVPAGMQATLGGNFAIVDVPPGQEVTVVFFYGVTNASDALGKETELIALQPTTLSLGQNYPNPFNPTTTISYELPEACYVTLQVFDVKGQEILSLVNQSQSAGRYGIPFNGRDLASGTYLYQLKAGSTVITKSMMLVK